MMPPSTNARTNAPMNFCPSLEPCPNDMKAAERSWSLPNSFFILEGGELRQIQEISQMTKKPKPKPKNVENKRPMRTFCQPSQRRTEGPAVARPAPVSPATRAWLSEVGRPK